MPLPKDIYAARNTWANILVSPDILRPGFLLEGDRVTATPFLMFYQAPERPIDSVEHREIPDENTLAIDLVIRPLLDSPTG